MPTDPAMPNPTFSDFFGTACRSGRQPYDYQFPVHNPGL
jgi:hypothetical protein